MLDYRLKIKDYRKQGKNKSSYDRSDSKNLRQANPIVNR